eukprot:5339196-Pyramimonas_sp.AAC.2
MGVPRPTKSSGVETHYQDSATHYSPLSCSKCCGGRSRGQFFQEVRPLGVPERVWTDVNGIFVGPPTCAADDAVDDSVKCHWRALAFRKHGALRAHVARTHRQNAALARAWASPDGH